MRLASGGEFRCCHLACAPAPWLQRAARTRGIRRCTDGRRQVEPSVEPLARRRPKQPRPFEDSPIATGLSENFQTAVSGHNTRNGDVDGQVATAGHPDHGGRNHIRSCPGKRLETIQPFRCRSCGARELKNALCPPREPQGFQGDLDFVLVRIGKRPHCRISLEERGPNPANLLGSGPDQHQLRNDQTVGILLAPPGKIAPVLLSPSQQSAFNGRSNGITSGELGVGGRRHLDTLIPNRYLDILCQMRQSLPGAKKVPIGFAEDQYEWLRVEAFRRRIPMAQLVREAVDEHRHRIDPQLMLPLSEKP